MPDIGQTLAHYTLEEKIGKGGMGEVFRAKDQKLGRDVAIKVLPEEFARDADRVARFQREAKLLASLNHPNIGSIYGLEEAEGTNFLVLELIEGDTLSDRLKHGAIPVEEALKLALQIAEALEAAHEKGVIHRDLKPANIKVTPDGNVKVLDFGLAKAYAGEKEDVNLSNSPTLSDAATQQGVILGTAAYMSPEQARGKQVDKRADVWAFGCVLYEMLAGKAAFSGRDVTDILAAVIRAEPEWKSLPTNLHWRLREVLERCLEKEAKDRFHDIADVRVDLQKVLDDPSGVFAQAGAAEEPGAGMRTILPWVAIALILGTIIAGIAVWNLRAPESPQVMRFDYNLPPAIVRFTSSSHRCVAISPDGTKIVYVGDRQLYLKNANEFAARPIQGTDESPLCPFFSPDGQWVGYFSGADNQYKKILITGGASITICEAKDSTGPSWETDDMIVFGGQGAIMRVAASGGTPEAIVKSEGDERLLFPQILPNGKSVLFTIVEEEGLQIAVQSIESGERKILFPGGYAQYVPTGHIVYELENNLTAIRFDLGTLEPIGGPVRLIEGVFRGRFNSPTHSAISDSGTLVYIPGRTMQNPSVIQLALVWIDRQGKEEPIAAEPNFYLDPKISPDGTKVALTLYSEDTSDIWTYDLVRKNLMRLTRNGNSSNPLWTPDGQRVVFVSDDEDKRGIYWRKADGTGKDELLGSVPDGMLIPSSWSKDEKTLITTKQPPQMDRLPIMVLIRQIRRRGEIAPKRSPVSEEEAPSSEESPEREEPSSDIGSLSMEGEHEWKPLLQEEYLEFEPQISPDGRWMAYTSNESERQEIYLRPFPDVNKGKWNVSIGGGGRPLWSPDAREIFYVGPDGLMAVSVETDPIVKLGTPQNLFSVPYMVSDISPDGQRFLALMIAQEIDEQSANGESASPFPRKINIVLNWFEELKERVPVD